MKKVPLVSCVAVVMVAAFAVSYAFAYQSNIVPGNKSALASSRPCVVPCEKPSERPCNKPIEGPCEKPIEGPCEKPSEIPCEKPAVKVCPFSMTDSSRAVCSLSPTRASDSKILPDKAAKPVGDLVTVTPFKPIPPEPRKQAPAAWLGEAVVGTGVQTVENVGIVTGELIRGVGAASTAWITPEKKKKQDFCAK